MTKLHSTILIIVLGAWVGPIHAQFDSGSDGSDGALDVISNTTIDLSLAATGTWDMPSPVAGQGVYDPNLWAVVFKYTTINVNAGSTVTFSNHPSGAPVVWLASGDVTIAGTVNLDGSAGDLSTEPPSYATPGPGGFAGGIRGINFGNGAPSSGFGPGGGNRGSLSAGGGGYATAGTTGGNGNDGVGGSSYGNDNILPLIGGSGGGGGLKSQQAGGGGAGGGAILIASSGTISLDYWLAISANGGRGGEFYSGGGSGGAIRLIANTIQGDGDMRATGGNGGSGGPSGGGRGSDGRIRVEAANILLTSAGNPAWTWSTNSVDPVFPDPSLNAPTLTATLLISATETQPVPADPVAGVETVDVMISGDGSTDITIDIEATNVPPGTTVQVTLMPDRGSATTVTSTPLVGSFAVSNATALVPSFPSTRRIETQLKANWTP